MYVNCIFMSQVYLGYFNEWYTASSEGSLVIREWQHRTSDVINASICFPSHKKKIIKRQEKNDKKRGIKEKRLREIW